MGTFYEKRPVNKYHNKAVTIGVERFDSIKEANRYSELKLMEKGGIISNLQRQVRFNLIPSQRLASGKHVPPVTYIADFVYTRDGSQVVEDVKGMKTAVYQIKKKLMLYQLGIEIKEV